MGDIDYSFNNLNKWQREFDRKKNPDYKDYTDLAENISETLKQEKPRDYMTKFRLLTRLRDCYKKASRLKGLPDFQKNNLSKRLSLMETSLEKLRETKTKSILPAIISSISLIFALVFTSFSLTGNVVAGLNETNSLWIGVVLFILGLVFAFLYFKGKRKNGA